MLQKSDHYCRTWSERRLVRYIHMILQLSLFVERYVSQGEKLNGNQLMDLINWLIIMNVVRINHIRQQITKNKNCSENILLSCFVQRHISAYQRIKHIIEKLEKECKIQSKKTIISKMFPHSKQTIQKIKSKSISKNPQKGMFHCE